MSFRQASAALVLVLCAGTSACDDFKSNARQGANSADSSATPTAAQVPAAKAASSTTVPVATPASQTDVGKAIEAATPGETAQASAATSAPSQASTAPASPSNVLVRAETLLDRVHFSPGAIDGKPGENLTRALAAFRAANGLGQGGVLDAATLNALAKASPGPVTQDYTITQADEAGPFIGPVPDDFVKLAKLDHTGYHDVVQELSARFHMSEGLLKALNPNVDFTQPGQKILVVQPGTDTLPQPARKVEVDKTNNQLRVFDASGKIEAVFPATVGSTERPAPTGQLTVLSVTPNPTYTYDPSKLTFGPKSHGKFSIKPGPNNPVGTTWIAVDNNGDGIHGTPDPTKVGKTASHGCVRLTNWDAETLRSAVSKGTPVDFIGHTTKATTS